MPAEGRRRARGRRPRPPGRPAPSPRIARWLAELLLRAVGRCRGPIALDLAGVPPAFARCLEDRFAPVAAAAPAAAAVVLSVRGPADPPPPERPPARSPGRGRRAPGEAALPRRRGEARRLDGPRSVLAEFPFAAPPLVQEAYLAAYAADAAEVARVNRAVVRALRALEALEVAADGASFWFPLRGARVTADGVTLAARDRSLQLPGGEVFAVSEGSAHGTIAVDLSRGGAPAPCVLRVRRGVVEDVERRAGAAQGMDPADLIGSRAVELGIGTNPCAIDLPFGCLFEKRSGTLHLGLEAPGRAGGLTHLDVPVLAPLPPPLRRAFGAGVGRSRRSRRTIPRSRESSR